MLIFHKADGVRTAKKAFCSTVGEDPCAIEQAAIVDVGKVLQQAIVPRRFWRRPLKVGDHLSLRVLGLHGRDVTLREVYPEEDDPLHYILVSYIPDVLGLGEIFTVSRRSRDEAVPAPGWPPWEAEAQRAPPTLWYQAPLVLESPTGKVLIHKEALQPGTRMQVVDIASWQEELRAIAAEAERFGPTELRRHLQRDRVFPGAVLVGRVRAAVLARPLQSAEMSHEAQSFLATAPALKDDVPDLLPLPRIGTYALGQVQDREPLRLSLMHPPGARAHLPLSGPISPPVGSWVRGFVQGVDIAADGCAVTLLAPTASVAESLLPDDGKMSCWHAATIKTQLGSVEDFMPDSIDVKNILEKVAQASTQAIAIANPQRIGVVTAHTDALGI
eukprot:s2457_g2.t1